jgi:hypothetical protein
MLESSNYYTGDIQPLVGWDLWHTKELTVLTTVSDFQPTRLSSRALVET